MLKRSLCLIVGFGLARFCFAADFNPFEGPKPLLVVIETDPWSMVLGSDSPRVAIYENGDAVFVGGGEKDQGYWFKRLSAEEREHVMQRARAVFLGKDLKHRYDVRGGTDQPMAKFYFNEAGSSVTTEVYGLGCKPPTPSPWDRHLEPPPQALLDLNRSLCALDFAGSEKWSPKYVEVMLWNYDYAPGASVPWPKDWPGLNSARTMRRGDSYSIFVDAAMLPQLKAFLSGVKEKSAIAIDGKKMSVSYRIPFPSEPVWRRAFESAE
jgi:hypothetical protein